MTDAVCCPGCRGEIDLRGEGARVCPSCGQGYLLRDGFADFTPEQDFYWGEISREHMQRVNRASAEQGWLAAVVEEVLEAGRENLAGYLLDPQRAAGAFHFYDPEENEAVLDLGSGWGPISFGLSRLYGTVYSLDGVAERLTFQAERARQDGVENLRILKGSMLRLPVKDNSMSAVVVNGLLEWIGLSDEVTDPRVLQVAFLNEVRRVLRPGGKIYIGIENRIGAQFFLGSVDHSGMSFTSLVPRRVASWMMRARRMTGSLVFSSRTYRTYTYSARGYRRLLAEAGYTQTALYWTWPTYNAPRASGTLDASSMRAYLQTLADETPGRAKRTLLRAAGRLPDAVLGRLVGAFAPHFLMVASKPPHRAGQQERLLSANGKTSFLRRTEPGSQLAAVYQELRGGQVSRVARVELDGTGQPVVWTEKTAGRPARAGSERDAELAARWLAAFQTQNGQGWWAAGELESEMGRLVSAARARLEGPAAGELLERFSRRYCAELAGARVARVPEHGQFTPRRVLVTDGGQVQAVGWAAGGAAGHPLMDSGAYLLALLRRGQGGAARAFSREYCRGMSLPARYAAGYAALRAAERDLKPGPASGEDYLLRREWARALEMALRAGVE